MVPQRSTYWKKNLNYLSILLIIWFLVSFGAGILFVENLNQIKLAGFKLGFWFAQNPQKGLSCRGFWRLKNLVPGISKKLTTLAHRWALPLDASALKPFVYGTWCLLPSPLCGRMVGHGALTAFLQ